MDDILDRNHTLRGRRPVRFAPGVALLAVLGVLAASGPLAPAAGATEAAPPTVTVPVPPAPESPPLQEPTATVDGVAVGSVGASPTPTFAEIVGFLDSLHQLLRFLDAASRPLGYVDLGNGIWGPEHLVAIRRCESGHDYGAVGGRGSFRGAYQFTQRTWNGVAARNGRPDLVGVRPNEASPADQDLLAVWNYEQSNPRRQWPVCSRRR